MGSCFLYAPKLPWDRRFDGFIHTKYFILGLYSHVSSTCIFITGMNKSQENHSSIGILLCSPWKATEKGPFFVQHSFSGDSSLCPVSASWALTKECITSTICPWLCLSTRAEADSGIQVSEAHILWGNKKITQVGGGTLLEHCVFSWHHPHPASLWLLGLSYFFQTFE